VVAISSFDGMEEGLLIYIPSKEPIGGVFKNLDHSGKNSQESKMAEEYVAEWLQLVLV